MEVVSNLNHDKIDLDFRGMDDDQQGPVQIQKAVSNLDLERNQEDLGFAGTRLIVRPDSRTQLPYMLPVGHSVPVWKIIAKFVSQDLSKVSLPVVLCEPLNILQRSAE